MKLLTVQKKSVWRSLLANGRHLADPDFESEWAEDPAHAWGFRKAYEWMGEQMQLRGLPKPESARYPVWGWAQRPDWPKGRMPERFLRCDEEMELLWLDIEPERVLLSDFALWHNVLNRWPLEFSETCSDKLDQIFSAMGFSPHSNKTLGPEQMALVQRNWPRIFDLAPTGCGKFRLRGADPQALDWCIHEHSDVQATFWELRLSDVVGHKRLAAWPKNKKRP